MSLTILHHDRTTIAVDTKGLVNASLLAKHFNRNPTEYLLLNETQPHITQIAKSNGRPMGTQWQENQVRIRHKPDFLRSLEAAKVIQRVAGTVGGHVGNARGVAGNGPIDYAPGLWVHLGLAHGLARWLECRGESWRPSPLADFIEKALRQTLPGSEA